MTKLKNKKVLITGGAGGLGLSLAEEMLKKGATVIITDINQNALKSAVKNLTKSDRIIYSRKVDVTSKKQVTELAQWIDETLNGIDVLINNAGIGFSGELIETDLCDWKRLINITQNISILREKILYRTFIERNNEHYYN